MNQKPNNIVLLKEALKIINSKEIIRTIKKALKSYILKWISFNFMTNKQRSDMKPLFTDNGNTFIMFFIGTLHNSPFIEDAEFTGKTIPVRQYLKFGNIIQASFNFITKNHKVREKKRNCACCICLSSFSPEDIEFVFVKNFVTKMRNNVKKENIKSIKNFLHSINKDSLVFFKRNSSEIDEFLTDIQRSSDLLFPGISYK